MSCNQRDLLFMVHLHHHQKKQHDTMGPDMIHNGQKYGLMPFKTLDRGISLSIMYFSNQLHFSSTFVLVYWLTPTADYKAHHSFTTVCDKPFANSILRFSITFFLHLSMLT